MRISWKVTLAALMLLISLSSRAGHIYPTAKNETLVRTFTYGQAQEIGFFGSSSTAWYRAASGNAKSVDDSAATILLCISASSSENGRCSTMGMQGVSGNETDIPLEFKEKRTNLVFTLNLRAVKGQSFSIPECQQKPEIIMDIASRGSSGDTCGKTPRDSATFKVYLPADQINKLPVGGKWVAYFKSNLTTVDGSMFVHNTQLTINVNDAGRSDIYFPEFGTAAPLLQLKLNKASGNPAGAVSAQRLVDICLYDGFSLYSQGFRIGFTGSDSSAFNLLHVNGNSSTAEKIIMELRYSIYPGIWQEVLPNSVFFVDTSGDYLTVNLPGLSRPVHCKKTTLKISVPYFVRLKKSAGLYKGSISIHMILH